MEATEKGTAAAGIVCALLVISSPAFAAITLCVEVQAPEAAAAAGLKKLVFDELGHYPSHTVVSRGDGGRDRDCASRLFVELFEAGKTSYLTARVDRGIPARYTVKDAADLGETVAKALRLVLESDPAYLAEDITRYSAAQRAAHSVLKRGHNRLRVEAYEVTAIADGASFAPGGAVSINRGADNWQVFSRVYFGGLPGAVPSSGRVLRIHAGGDAGLVYELNALSWSTFYLGAGAGVQVVSFEGRADPSDPKVLDTRTDVGLDAFVRAGVRFLRFYDFDCDLFTAAYLPVWVGGDPDSLLARRWSPSFIAGIGVGF